MKKLSLTVILKDFLIPFIILIAISFLLVLFLIPKFNEILSIRKDIQKKDIEIEKLSQKLADLQTLSEAELYDMSTLLLSALPTKNDYYGILSSIRKSALDNNVILTDFNLTPGIVDDSDKPSGNGAVLSSSFDLSFSAPDVSFKDFLTSIENSLPLISIKTIKIETKTSTESASFTNFTGEASIDSYFLGLPTFLGSTDKPLQKIDNNDKKFIDELKNYSVPVVKTDVTSLENVIVGKENPFPF